jgi:Na+/pantothenate symporter
MAEGFPRELRRAFLETGALVLGGIAGGGAAYFLFGAHWIVQALCAVGCAWLAHYLVMWAMRRSSDMPEKR